VLRSVPEKRSGQNEHVNVPATKVPVLSLRGAVAGLTMFLGVMHLLVAVGRAHDWAWEGAALAATGVVQVVSALRWVVSDRRSALVSVLVVGLGPAIVLVLARLSGYPFGPFDGYSPSVSSYELVLLTVSVITSALAAGALVTGRHRVGAPGWRLDTLSLVAVVVAAVPGLATTKWVDDASSVSGAGHSHSHTDASGVGLMAQELTLEDRRVLAEQVVLAREVTVAVPTLQDALDAGWTKVGEPITGGGQMVMDTRVDHRDLPFDPSTPMGLLYASDDPSAPVVGLQYGQWTSEAMPADVFVGQSSMWHLHTATCVIDGDEGEFALTIDDPLTGVGCEKVDGTREDRIGFMLRVWVVPGWENPYGTFAHDHPGIVVTS